ncbi:probable lipase Mil1p [Diutina catenulata]
MGQPYINNAHTTQRHLTQSRTRASTLPNLPTLAPVASNDDAGATDGLGYVEFDMTSPDGTQKFIRSHTDLASTRASHDSEAPPPSYTSTPPSNNSGPQATTAPDVLVPETADDDDFFDDKNWKTMEAFTETEYYNEKGDLEFQNTFNMMADHATSQGYTKIDTAEQVAKYSEMDKQTDFLFTSADENDDIVDSMETLESTKDMLTEAQRYAYVGIVKLITVEMATDLAKLKLHTSSKIARQLAQGQKNFSNWTMYVMDKLYGHMSLSPEENMMIENLCKHGVDAADLTASLLDKTITYHNPKFDLRWVVICDMFLLLVSDGYYDSRSRTLLVWFSRHIGIGYIEILQFERRLIEMLELEAKDKSLENDDTKFDDHRFIDRHIKKNRKKRLAFIGLATLGGGLAIGLSMGLLAPVIGAGLAAGFTTIGIGGTSGFLAGVGGSAVITTTGVVLGLKVGNKAGKRRAGDVHTFEFKPLHNNKRTNLVITVSGWMNGKMDDVRLPFSTVDPVMGDVFSLLWEPDMLQSMGQTITILASEALSSSIQQILGATILTSLMAAIQLPVMLSKLTYIIDNPWNVSLDRAWKAGKILADTLVSGNMGVRPITLVGFSLGARLIYSCLIELAKRDCYGLVENVILLGTPVAINHDQLALARSVVSGKYVNGYSKKDWILGYLFRATSGGLSSVAGLSAIDKFGIEDFDCTSLVEGHMAYRVAIPKILKEFGWEVLSEEFVEIEQPDPETNERQRKLLSEFDEARAKMEKEKNTKKRWWQRKNKSWWDIRGKDPVTTDDKGEDPDEYQVEDEGALFDISALQDEVKALESMGHEDNPAKGTPVASPAKTPRAQSPAKTSRTQSPSKTPIRAQSPAKIARGPSPATSVPVSPQKTQDKN